VIRGRGRCRYRKGLVRRFHGLRKGNGLVACFVAPSRADRCSPSKGETGLASLRSASLARLAPADEAGDAWVGFSEAGANHAPDQKRPGQLQL
jgi:hypothetical protein